MLRMDLLSVDLGKTGALSRAVELQREVAAWWRTRESEEPSETAHAETRLGVSLIKLGEFNEAREVLEHAVGIMGDSNPEAPVGWLARALEGLGDLKGALKLREETVSVSTLAYGPEDRRTLNAVELLAATLGKLGQRDRARDLMEASLASRERVWGDDDPDTRKARERLTAFPRDPE
jgi:tetratricopeptide (TPR) repeat protein